MTDPQVDEVPSPSIPQVRAFLKAMKELEEWKRRHGPALKQLAAIAKEYNPLHVAAEKAVRERRVSCRPWMVTGSSKKRDAEALCAALGRERFIALGGQVVDQCVMDNVLFDGVIVERPELAPLAVAVSLTYSKPKLIVVP